MPPAELSNLKLTKADKEWFKYKKSFLFLCTCTFCTLQFIPSLLLEFNKENKMDQCTKDSNVVLEEDMPEYLEDLDGSDGEDCLRVGIISMWKMNMMTVRLILPDKSLLIS